MKEFLGDPELNFNNSQLPPQANKQKSMPSPQAKKQQPKNPNNANLRERGDTLG